MGGNGIYPKNQAIKMLCDIEAIHMYKGSREIETLVVWRDITSLSAFK